jgi:O-antigen ligase
MSEARVEEIPAGWDRVVRQSWWVTLISMWLMMLMTFGAPNREGALKASELDGIAVSKILTRGVCLIAMGITVIRLWGHPRRPRVGLCVLPMGLYVLYCILSTLWSPLPMITLGQSITALGMQCLLMFLIAVLWQSEEDTSRIFLNLVLVGTTVAIIMLIVHALFEDLSGLRGVEFDEMKHGRGIHHPTDLGAAASLTILILVASLLFWGWRWCRILLLPVLIANGLIILMAANRMSIFCTALIGGLLFLFSGRRVLVAVMALGIGLALFGYMMFDPKMHAANDAIEAAEVYLVRGEDSESIKSGTGRTDMWKRVFEEFLKSPLIGHGFFITSQKGTFYMWGMDINWTSHNVWLHLLVTTGVIGFCIFVWGFVQIIAQSWACFRSGESDLRLGYFLGFMLFWYLTWTTFDDTFVQSISLGSAMSYVFLGIAAGQLRPRRPPVMYDMFSVQARNGSPDPISNGQVAVPCRGPDRSLGSGVRRDDRSGEW